MDTTFITRIESAGSGLRVAVKDAIDLAGVPTTAGSKVVADAALPAAADAECLAGMRAAGVRFVGKANLHELCFGGTGINPWFGTPVNPIDPECIPGGSSSGSAVAVARGEAELALGTDTAGSIRNPAACCGVVGLKTTWGRVSLVGVRPLAPSLDTVGLLARSVGSVAEGMELLDPGFVVPGPSDSALRIGRVRGLDGDPLIEAAIDSALARAELEVTDVRLSGWAEASEAGVRLMFTESLVANRTLVDHHLAELGADLQQRFGVARGYGPEVGPVAALAATTWRAELADQFERVDLLALPTMNRFPPRLDDTNIMPNPLAVPVNLAGVPALAVPVGAPGRGRFPASLQLIGPHRSEGLLLAVGAVLAAATRPSLKH